MIDEFNARDRLARALLASSRVQRLVRDDAHDYAFETTSARVFDCDKAVDALAGAVSATIETGAQGHRPGCAAETSTQGDRILALERHEILGPIHVGVFDDSERFLRLDVEFPRSNDFRREKIAHVRVMTLMGFERRRDVAWQLVSEIEFVRTRSQIGRSVSRP